MPIPKRVCQNVTFPHIAIEHSHKFPSILVHPLKFCFPHQGCQYREAWDNVWHTVPNLGDSYFVCFIQYFTMWAFGIHHFSRYFLLPTFNIVMWQQYRIQPPLAMCSLTRLFLCEEAFIMLLLMLEEPKGCGCNGLIVSVIQSPNTLWNKGVRITEYCSFCVLFIT